MMEELKQRAAVEAAERVRSGMVLGLGSGSTVRYFVEELGRRLAEGRIRDVVAVPTSSETEHLAHASGVPLATLNGYPTLDLAVDGADEVDLHLDLIKGRGGALLREKIVALAARRLVIIVDASKLVGRLGERVPIPVEVVPFGWGLVAARLGALGGRPLLRKGAEGRPFVTDEGHYILDCAFGSLDNLYRLAEDIRRIVGVVEHGLFLGIAQEVIVAASDGVTVLVRESPSRSPLPGGGKDRR